MAKSDSLSLRQANEQLRQALSNLYDRNEATAIAERIMEHISGLSRLERISYPERVLDAQQQEQFDQYKKELEQGRPLQYVLKQADFYGLSLFVDESVLIPRPETEELVGTCLKHVKAQYPAGISLNILDIGTGSGSIALALKKNLESSAIYAADISVSALATAAKNAQQNQLIVHFLKWDILTIPPPQALPKKIDIIISNPPYITKEERGNLHANVKDFEPGAALFVTNDDPLQFYKKIEQIGSEKLAIGGCLFLELHEHFAKDTQDYFQMKGWQAKLIKDFQDKSRILFVSRPTLSKEKD